MPGLLKVLEQHKNISLDTLVPAETRKIEAFPESLAQSAWWLEDVAAQG